MPKFPSVRPKEPLSTRTCFFSDHVLSLLPYPINILKSVCYYNRREHLLTNSQTCEHVENIIDYTSNFFFPHAPLIILF